jgi:magnesium-protoporphyrin IX monomethyl ester (oxidative) cyclase
MSAVQMIATPDEAARKAKESTLLSPRFYTTDFAAMDRIDVSPMRAEWDAMMAEYEGDNNHDHFQRTEQFARRYRRSSPGAARAAQGVPRLPDQLGDLGVLGLHALQRDPEERSQPRHQGIDALHGARRIAPRRFHQPVSLKDFGLGVDLGGLKRTKAYTYFKPKYIFYATYLSEKIGYARYITIFRQLEATPTSASIRSFAGSSAGATTNSATARASR